MCTLYKYIKLSSTKRKKERNISTRKSRSKERSLSFCAYLSFSVNNATNAFSLRSEAQPNDEGKKERKKEIASFLNPNFVWNPKNNFLFFFLFFCCFNWTVDSLDFLFCTLEHIIWLHLLRSVVAKVDDGSSTIEHARAQFSILLSREKRVLLFLYFLYSFFLNWIGFNSLSLKEFIFRTFCSDIEQYII